MSGGNLWPHRQCHQARKHSCFSLLGREQVLPSFSWGNKPVCVTPRFLSCVCDHKDLQGKVIWTYSSKKHSPSWWRSHGCRKARCLGPLHLGSGSREKQKPSLFSHPRTPVHGLVPSAFRVGLSRSINPIQNLPQRHARGFVSIRILNVIQLTMKMNPRSHYVPHPYSEFLFSWESSCRLA